MPKSPPRCLACGRVYRADPHNAHHQVYCTRADCVRERKRKRQREHYTAKCRGDPGFREQERQRCRAANRKRRAACRVRPAAAEPPVGDTLALFETVCGLVSQLADITDPILLQASLRGYRDRGHRVAVQTPDQPLRL